MRTKEEIYEQLDEAMENEDCCRGMTYIEGVKAALEWAIGDVEETPVES